MRASLFLLLLPGVALAQAPAETPSTPDASAPPAQTAPAPAEPTPAPAPADSAPADSAPAIAQSPTPVPPPSITELITPDAMPAPCKSIAKEALAPAINRALSARISLASCLADYKLKPLVLCDCEQSINDVNASTLLSLTLLDDVFTHGDAAMQILARQARGDLLSALVQRMQATVPPPVNASPESIALRDTRIDLLRPMIEPWQVQARSAYTDVDKLAKANPKLAKNPAVLAAVRSSRAKLGVPATQTATR